MKRAIMMDEFDLYREAIEAWGPDIQIIVLMEECAELIKECSKVLRERRMSGGGISDTTTLRFIEEMVDVTIMINQMQHGWLNNPIDFTRFKIDKLKKVKRWLRDSEFVHNSEESK